MALGYAGVALAVLALIMPALLVMKSRREHPQATAGRRRRTDAMAGSAVRDRHRGYSVQHRCRVVARGGIKKGPAGPCSFAKQHCLYFYRCRMGRIVASDFRFISYWLRGLHRLRIRYPVLVKRQRRRRDTLNAGDKFIRRQIIQRAKLFFAAVGAIASSSGWSSAGNVDQSLSATPRR